VLLKVAGFCLCKDFFPLFEAKALGNEFLTGQLDDYSTID
jgi:hypothetical protein